jgi:hypothetical protein
VHAATRLHPRPNHDAHRNSASEIAVRSIQSRQGFRLARYSLNLRNLGSLFSQPLRMRKTMGNDENKPFWGKNSRGFWLIVCLTISAVAGWLMFQMGILH